MDTTFPETKSSESKFNLSVLSPAARSLVNRAASNPQIFQKFITDPEAAWVEFGQDILPAEKRTLELMAELFFPQTSVAIVPKITMDSVWVSNR